MLFSSADQSAVGLLKSLLEDAGIPCEIRNENAFANFPGASFYPELWLLNDHDYPAAVELLDTWTKSVSGNSHSRDWEKISEPTTALTPPKRTQVNRSSWRADFLFCAICGVGMLVLSIFALILIIGGKYTVVAHFTQKYGMHYTSGAFALFFITGGLGTILIWRAVGLRSENQRKSRGRKKSKPANDLPNRRNGSVE